MTIAGIDPVNSNCAAGRLAGSAAARATSLAAATLAAVPLALFYDLMLAGIARLWLLRADGAYRLPNWGRWFWPCCSS